MCIIRIQRLSQSSALLWTKIRVRILGKSVDGIVSNAGGSHAIDVGSSPTGVDSNETYWA